MLRPARLTPGKVKHPESEVRMHSQGEAPTKELTADTTDNLSEAAELTAGLGTSD